MQWLHKLTSTFFLVKKWAANEVESQTVKGNRNKRYLILNTEMDF